MTAYLFLEWGITAALALGASLLALKVFKLKPVWAVIVGMVVFTGLNFHIPTHAVLVKMPQQSN